MSVASSSAWPSASDRSDGRRRFLASAVGALLILGPRAAGAQEGVFLSAAEAPRILFPDASTGSEQTVASTPELQRRIRALLGRPPTLWESGYQIFTLRRGEATAGFVVVEEIGKHRPITFAVGVTPAGRIHDLVVLAYREPYGVRSASAASSSNTRARAPTIRCSRTGTSATSRGPRCRSRRPAGLARRPSPC